MKKIIAFSLPVEYAQQIASSHPVRGFAEGDIKGYEVDQVIFSTAFNRNRCYFQVSKLLGYADKLTKLMSNINHDLSITGGKYVPASEAGYTKIWSELNNGELEIWGTFRATHPLYIERMREFNAPSVELMVDERTAIMNENGEYYDDFEWFATAQLAGIPAGSGDARNASNVREFNLDLTPYQSNIMNEEQVQTLLKEQEERLSAKFSAEVEELKSEVEQLKAEQQPAEVLPESQDTASADEDAAEDVQLEQVNNALEQVNNATKAFEQVKGSESQLDSKSAGGDVAESAKARLSAYNKLKS